MLHSILVDTVQVTEKHSINNLGLNIDSKLAWDNYLDYLKGDLNKIGLLYRLRTKLDKKELIIILFIQIWFKNKNQWPWACQFYDAWATTYSK